MNRYIQKLIHEQFNIGNMDLNNSKLKHNMNIFNKEINHPYYYKVLDNIATESEIKELDSFVSVAAPKDKDELRKIIKFYSENYPEDSLNWLDVSRITDMSNLFKGEFYYENRNKYNGDISKWDTSNVIDMSYMFAYSMFNNFIGCWNVSNVTDMKGMFYCTEKFNQDISRWDVSNVTDMSYMFCDAERFNCHIDKWDVSSVTNMSYMFCNTDWFNSPINDWNVSNVTDMNHMFFHAYEFNQPIGKWNVSNVTDMNHMFYLARYFKRDISHWNINDKTNTIEMFKYCPIQKKYKPIKCR